MKAPQNLEKLIESGQDTEFRLRTAFYVELNHTLIGFFPAIESETGEVVMTTDPELLRRVCRTLKPRPFVLKTQLIYIDPATGIAYSVLGIDRNALPKALPFLIYDRAQIERLLNNPEAFRWTAGVGGPHISQEKFLEAIETAFAKI